MGSPQAGISLGMAVIAGGGEATGRNPFRDGSNNHYKNLCWATAGTTFYYNSPTEGLVGNLGAVAVSSDPWICGMASPNMGSWINSAGVLPHFQEDDPLQELLEWYGQVGKWISLYYSHLVAVKGRCNISHVHAGTLGFTYMEIHTVKYIFVWIKW